MRVCDSVAIIFVEFPVRLLAFAAAVFPEVAVGAGAGGGSPAAFIATEAVGGIGGGEDAGGCFVEDGVLGGLKFLRGHVSVAFLCFTTGDRLKGWSCDRWCIFTAQARK